MMLGNAGAVIRARRTQLGLTCRQLGERVGVDVSTISRYENNETGIRYDKLIPLANALDMPVTDFIDLSKIPMPEPDDYERMCGALRALGVIRLDGSVSFKRLAHVELLMKTVDSIANERE